MEININKLNYDMNSLFYTFARENDLKFGAIKLVFSFESLIKHHHLSFELGKFLKELRVSFNKLIEDESILDKLIGEVGQTIKDNLIDYQKMYFYDNPDYSQGLYYCISSYSEVKNPNLWQECPNCKLKPLINIFNNGAYTSCGCGESDYAHFSIRAESLMSRYNRLKNAGGNSEERLMNNWNHWCLTGEDLFEKEKKRIQDEENIKIW